MALQTYLQEVLAIVELIAWIYERLTDRLLVTVRSNRGQLGHQAWTLISISLDHADRVNLGRTSESAPTTLPRIAIG